MGLTVIRGVDCRERIFFRNDLIESRRSEILADALLRIAEVSAIRWRVPWSSRVPVRLRWGRDSTSRRTPLARPTCFSGVDASQGLGTVLNALQGRYPARAPPVVALLVHRHPHQRDVRSGPSTWRNPS